MIERSIGKKSGSLIIDFHYITFSIFQALSLSLPVNVYYNIIFNNDDKSDFNNWGKRNESEWNDEMKMRGALRKEIERNEKGNEQKNCLFNSEILPKLFNIIPSGNERNVKSNDLKMWIKEGRKIKTTKGKEKSERRFHSLLNSIQYNWRIDEKRGNFFALFLSRSLARHPDAAFVVHIASINIVFIKWMNRKWKPNKKEKKLQLIDPF